MADILQTTFLYCKFMHLIQISMKCVPSGAFDILSTLVQMMAWHRAGDKPLFAPMVLQFTGVFMCHSA